MRASRVLGACLAAVALAATPAQATFPGANGKLAIVIEETQFGDYTVATVNPDGSDLTRLTPPPERAYNPTWSPDGRRIAFVAHASGEHDDLFLIDADGQNRVRILDEPPIPAGPSWSPDGERIVFSYFDLWTIGTDGSGLTHLFGDAGLNPSSEPDWSPDGSRIAFIRAASGVVCDEEGECIPVFKEDLWVVNSGGSGARPLTNDSGFDASPSWSPDGERILFTHEGRLDVIDADGGNRQTVATDAVDGVWSPDGTKIAFRSRTDLYVMDADGTDRTLVLDGDFAYPIYREPDWQPLPNRPPDCAGVTASPDVLWPVNKKLRTATVSGATDQDGDEVSLQVTAVTDDEGAGAGAWEPGGNGTVLLRAERDAHGDGRVYTVSFRATDEHGASCTGTATVSVPRHKR